ncbi:hypothetical protein SLEP1_g37643 [Rubroshorea leprosula]|uniref:Reverse transcriptase Ty1/copia-type domain-containing protein n=1 Tax=Rubroshorea leprosula TaxID=152421 RepID=A0AAV5KVH7_9ROSI|nr:hypothetical protein SLEP1_g37643 [Rubroshorea leprosula]
MFFSLSNFLVSSSNFQVSSFDQPPFFTNPSVELIPSDSDVVTFDEFYNASPHAPTSSTEDDMPVGNALNNFELSSTSSSISPVDVASDIVEFTNEFVVPSSSRPTQASTNPLWQQAMQDELQVLENTRTLDLIDLSTKNKVYMKPPPGLNHPPNKVCRLRRALYGLKQSLRAWYAKFSATVSQFGFTSSPHDRALFIRKIAQGLEVTSSSDGYLLSQVKYASDLVSKAELNDSKSVSTPLEPNVKLTPMNGSPLSDPTRYRQLVDSLVYLTTTRLNIAYAVHIVS